MKHQAMSTKHGSEEMNTSQHCTEKKKKSLKEDCKASSLEQMEERWLSMTKNQTAGKERKREETDKRSFQV